MSKDDKRVFDEYIDKFISSDLSIIKIKDEKHPQIYMKKGLKNRIKERGINTITVYTFLNDLLMEKT